MENDRGVLMMSGGIDSTVLAYYLASRGLLHSVILCDYGQASAAHQYSLVIHHAARLGVEAHRERIDWPSYARGKGFIFDRGRYPEAMTDAYEPVGYNEEERARYLEEKWDFIQGRNMIFLTRAAMWATLVAKVDVLYTAFQFDEPEWAVMPEDGVVYGCDTTSGFVDRFNELSQGGGFSRPIRVDAPFLQQKMTKPQIVALGHSLGVSFEKTYSCEFFPACGGCHQCIVRRTTFAAPVRFR